MNAGQSRGKERPGRDRRPRRGRRAWPRILALVFLLILVLAGPAQAQGPEPSHVVPAALRDVGFDQRIGEQVPLDLTFRDEEGQAVRLGAYFSSGKPVILTLNYFSCPNFCDVELNGLVEGLLDVPWKISDQFNVISVSFDPRDTPVLAAGKKSRFAFRYSRHGAATGWHFLTGDPISIQRLTQAVGFRYKYDATHDEYAHPAGILVLTPQGTIARYLYGTEFSPTDLRLALVEASQGKLGSPVDQVLLLCYHYVPALGKYSALALNALRLTSVLTVLVLGAFLLLLWREDLRADGQTTQRVE